MRQFVQNDNLFFVYVFYYLILKFLTTVELLLYTTNQIKAINQKICYNIYLSYGKYKWFLIELVKLFYTELFYLFIIIHLIIY